ncbi:hypothetical protein [Deinococcus humi]|uniref:Lipoprotein n=1 Tax=Deinococcus humi TaxID=662880 RepID=A0A7W8NI77_9DEIO|nr:hypothetical protein [Deinococcus humi]MBB5364772.1 hypothetical protein [Deinococcus humi]
MKKFLLLVPALLAACAPAYTGPKPGPNEIIVEAVSTLPTRSKLSPENEAGVMGFAMISALLVNNFRESPTRIGLPAGYENFTFPESEVDSDKLKLLSAKEEPVHIKMNLVATNADTKNTVNLEWESRPIGGKLLSVTVKANSTDTAVNTRTIEDRLIAQFVKQNGIRLIASGR